MKKPLPKTFSIDWTAGETLVERPGPGKAPTAFRIWHAGRNEADGDFVLFTRRSAELLMNEQIARARRYPSDFDHLSLKTDRPAMSGRASGWHSLDVRIDANGEPELWATDIEWCEDTKVGLELSPPHWRYFSPAFGSSDSGEVVSYTNFALCINPLTHGLPALAAHTIGRHMPMNGKAAAAMLKAMADATEDPDKKEALSFAFAAMGGEGEEPEAKKEAAEGEDEPKPEAKKEAEGEEPEAKKEAAEGEDEPKKEAKAHAAVASSDVALENVKLKARLDRLEIDALIGKRADLSESVRTWCATQPLEVVKSFLAKVKLHSAARPSSPTQGKPGPALLEGRDREELDVGMGMRPTAPKGPERLDDGRFVLHTVRPSDVRTLAAKGKV